MTVDQAWKDRIVAAHARDAVKVTHSDRVMPPFNLPQVGTTFAPRVLRTSLTDQLERDPDSVDPQELAIRVRSEILAGGGHDLLPFTGQSAELVHDVLPAADPVTRLATECRSALRHANANVPRPVGPTN